jgi:sister-chromatid-cohesion protein PDS5
MMEVIVNPNVKCAECADAVSQVLKKLGQPVMTNLYYNIVKLLLERVSSVMVDKESLGILVGCVKDALNGGETAYEFGVLPTVAGEKGLKLLFVLSFVFPSHFIHSDILTQLLEFLSYQDENVAPLVLSILTFVGKHKPIGEEFPSFIQTLIPICQKFATDGTPKQAKHAIRCLHVNAPNNDAVFNTILERLKEQMSMENPHFRTSLVSLGHIAYNLPDAFPVQIKNIVSRKVVKELLMKDQSETSLPDDAWVEEEELPVETRCKVTTPLTPGNQCPFSLKQFTK